MPIKPDSRLEEFLANRVRDLGNVIALTFHLACALLPFQVIAAVIVFVVRLLYKQLRGDQ